MGEHEHEHETAAGPCDAAAERGVLAALLLDGGGAGGLAHRLAADLRPGHFGDPVRAEIFSAAAAVLARGPLDVVLLAAELRSRGRLNTIGGPQALGELTDDVVSLSAAEAWGAIVRRDARARAVIAAATRCAARARTPGEEDLAGRARAVVDAAAEDSTTELESLASAVEEEEARLFGDAPSDVVGTGLRDLDRALAGGLWPGQLVVLGARPSVGKSALALLLALEAARRCEGTGGCVLYLSLEMPRRDLAARAGVLLGSDGSAPPLSLQRVRDRALRDAEVHRYGRALGAVARLPLLVVDRRDLRPSAVRGLALRAAAQHGRVSLVVVDYLQLLRAEVRSDSREREVAEVSRALQALAGELGCPVLALSQLNRKAAEKERRPTMADLRESGAIEQDADVILLLHREEGDRARPVLLVEKQRNGLAPQELPLGWIAEAARFADAGAMGGIDVAEDAWSA